MCVCVCVWGGGGGGGGGGGVAEYSLGSLSENLFLLELYLASASA